MAAPGPNLIVQRVRVGLIGLSCVFLLVALAAALLRMTGSDAVAGNATELAENASMPVPNEPLAQLGVAPGNAPPAPAPAPAAGGAAPRGGGGH